MRNAARPYLSKGRWQPRFLLRQAVPEQASTIGLQRPSGGDSRPRFPRSAAFGCHFRRSVTPVGNIASIEISTRTGLRQPSILCVRNLTGVAFLSRTERAPEEDGAESEIDAVVAAGDE
jgi:hypothetical protein